MAVQILLLGPVQVLIDASQLDIGPARQRTVLAALLVDAGRPVSIDTLIGRVWGEHPPGGARRGVYAYVTRLRQALNHDDPQRPLHLDRRPGGYLIDVDPESVDLHRFRRLVGRAGDGCADSPGRVELLDEALALWRGPALADLSGPWVEATRHLLGQQRLDAVLMWTQTHLAADRPDLVIGALREVLAEHRLSEPAAAHLMEALHRSGRTAEALDCYATIRRYLVEALGTEPGAELRQLHQAMLRGEHRPVAVASSSRPAGDKPPAKPSGVRTSPTRVPAQLPAALASFTGRREELAKLDNLLSEHHRGTLAVVISAIGGTPGVGKTTLAVYWAHQVAGRFPDGQLYMNLRGFDSDAQVMDPSEAVRRFLDALDVPAERIPTELHARAALYRSQLAGRRMLIVLDNARDSAQIRPLLPGTPTCLVLVTSRSTLTGLVAVDGAHPITLDLLPIEDAYQMLERRLGAQRVAAEPQAAHKIIAGCARLPLALAIVAARAATQPDMPLATLAGQLEHARAGLQALTGDDPYADVRAVFSWSYRALTSAAARLFRLLGLHPGPDLAAPAAASLAALSLPAVMPLLAELTRMNLTAEHGEDRYACHDLLRAYATELVHRVDDREHRQAAIHRLFDHYVHTAYAADRMLYPTRDPILLALTPPQPGVVAEPHTDPQHALAWFVAERQILLGAVRVAAQTGFDTHAWQLAWALDTFLTRHGHWPDRASVWRAAVCAAERLGEPTPLALAHHNLAAADISLGLLDDAHDRLQLVLTLCRQADDKILQAHAHAAIASVRQRQGGNQQAFDHIRQALDLFRAVGHLRGQAFTLNGLGWCHAHQGEYLPALAACDEAIALYQKLDDRNGQANTWDSLGYAHRQLGHHAQAIACYERALVLFRDLADRGQQAQTLTNLGDAHHSGGNIPAARVAWHQALAILDDLDHPSRSAVHAKLAAVGSVDSDSNL